MMPPFASQRMIDVELVPTRFWIQFLRCRRAVRDDANRDSIGKAQVEVAMAMPQPHDIAPRITDARSYYVSMGGDEARAVVP